MSATYPAGWALVGGVDGGSMTDAEVLEAYNQAIADIAPIDAQFDLLATDLGNGTQSVSAPLYTVIRDGSYDLNLKGRNTAGNGAVGSGVVFVQLGTFGLISHYQGASGSVACHLDLKDVAMVVSDELTISHGWYGSGAPAEMDWKLTIRERGPFTPA